MSYRSRLSKGQLNIAMVLDSGLGLASRKLDLYRFFNKPPRIVVVRRRPVFHTDTRIDVRQKRIYLPVGGLDNKDLRSVILAFTSAFGYLLHAPYMAARLRSRGQSIDLVHAHFIFPQGFFGLIVAYLCRVPLIVSAVGDDVNRMMKGSALLRALCSLVLKQADTVIAVSLALHKSLQRFGITNSVYQPNSIDPDYFSWGRTPLNHSILFVGNLTANKRPMLVLRAFERTARVVVDANLTIVGEGPLTEAVQETIRRRQIGNRVRLIPNAEPSLVRELLLQTRVFVIASEREGLSNALIEAMATRKVIVASSNDSHREILRDGHEALLFRIDDEQDLTELMISALTDEQLGERLSASAQELCARQFSSTKLGPRLEKIYWTVVRKTTLIPAED